VGTWGRLACLSLSYINKCIERQNKKQALSEKAKAKSTSKKKAGASTHEQAAAPPT